MNEYAFLFNIILFVISAIFLMSLSDVIINLVKKPQKTLQELTVEAEEYERRSNIKRD
jgi:hypothetical protein